jgi:hypothetical protein
MLDNIEIDQSIRVAILNLMVVLYDCGIEEIHLGGIMRILGVGNDRAQKHDDEWLVIDENFIKYVEQINEPRPADQILH